ncbi:zinc finger, C3HC4 type [Dictyocaulus viviparus]|uniref:E3 ubiquitin-protein ligase listerin n=1 Tax=Dictyocaulus viviparus TaxID=29172 RepID=A0A0D8XVK6_DICVI|nr:zinc finger, C3HC4 type [Dictyocaulus viviparus]
MYKPRTNCSYVLSQSSAGCKMSKPQRRKGNAKNGDDRTSFQSASSSQAAAFLERTGFSTTYSGFDSAATNVFEVASAKREGALCHTLDQDIVLVMRKLSKKDHQTREKGLRDLLSILKGKEQEMVETCYNHYAIIMGRLVLDGSPTVRMLSLQLTTFFISSLKKAAEKQLKLIIPFVLIAICDASFSVANQAESVLVENFPDEKNVQVISIFATDTMKLAIDIIAGRHTLVQPEKYDSLDSSEQRHARLTTQCLLAIARLAPTTFCNEKLKEAFSSFLMDTSVIKTLAKGSAPVKSALLEVCIKIANCVPIFNNTFLVTWIISNLDSQEYSVCRKAFEALILMASDERFYEKFDVNKCVVPKIMSVVKKKRILVQIIRCIDKVADESHGSQETLVSFLLWILDKDMLHIEHKTFLLDSLQLTLIGKRPRTNVMCALLVTPGHWLIRNFHVALLRSPPLLLDFVKPLTTCSEDYLSYVDKNIHLVNTLSKEVQSSSHTAQVVLRVLRQHPSQISELDVRHCCNASLVFLKDCKLSSSCFISFLFNELTCDDWPLLSSNMGAKLIPSVKEFFNRCYEEKNYFQAVKVLNLLKLPEDLKAELSRLLFLSLFDGVADNDVEIVLDLVKRFPPRESLIRNIISSVLLCPSNERLKRIGLLCSQLICSEGIYVALLPSQDELLSMLTILDTWVTCDIIAHCGLFADPLCNKLENCISEEEQFRFVYVCAEKALIYLNIDYEGSTSEPISGPEHDVSLAYAATVVPILRLLHSTRWRIQTITDTLSDVMNQWDHTFHKTTVASHRAISTLLRLPRSFSSAQLALCHIRNSNHVQLPLSSWKEPEKKVAWYWALKSDCSNLNLDSIEQWITRFHFDSRFDFLSLVYQHIQSDSSEWEDSIFNANFLNTPSWRVSCLCIIAAIDVISETTLSSLSSDLLDFILCGVVTAMDSCDEKTEMKFDDSIQFESLAGLSLKLFNSDLSFFVHNLVSAVHHVHKLPDNLSLKKKLCPELDKLEYDDINQTLIIHSEDLLLSENIFIRFAALHMLKILSPLMYKQENSLWMEADNVSITGPRHLVVPETFSRLINQTTGWPAIMAFDCALVPLLTCITSEEERVAYCNVLLHPITSVLPQILAKCPNDIRGFYAHFQNRKGLCLSILTIIAKAKERDFFVTQSFELTVDAYERYAANLLFRYICHYVSKHLINAELNKVKLANQKFLKEDKLLKNISVYRVLSPTYLSGEVTAEYKVEETTMKLSIALPSNWPLSVPSIQLDKAIVPSEKAKKWLLQLTAYLFHQNGSIVDGIMMWRRNVDRDVDGAEACTVCMMTIHPTNHQLPKVKCRQCKNKFHSNCLYKWFESSSQSTCPLCRANFM